MVKAKHVQALSVKAVAKTVPPTTDADGAPAFKAQVERTERVGEWTLAFLTTANGGHIHDLELGRRLGLTRPRLVRDTIKELLRDGKLNDSDVCRVWRQTPEGGRPGWEFYLNKRAALKVAIHCRTKTADKIHDELIMVFDAWTEGRLVVAQQASLDGQAILLRLEAMQADTQRAWADVRAENDALRADMARTRIEAAQAKADVAALRAVVDPYLEHPERLRPLNVLRDDGTKVEEFNTKIDTLCRSWKGAGIPLSRKKAIGIVCRRWHPHGNSYLALPYSVLPEVMRRLEEWTDKPDPTLLKRRKGPGPASTVASGRMDYLPGVDWAAIQKSALRPN